MSFLKFLGRDVVADVRARRPLLKDDWRTGLAPGVSIIAPSLYIAIASALPALAFGQQLSQDTAGTLTVVHVLTATAITGVIQSIFGGQPLLIVGVAEPIVLIYGFLYTFAEGRPDQLGAGMFLPWASWVCVWTSMMLVVLALSGSCRLIDKFTRFSGELFGMLIAILFMQVAIRGLISEFHALPAPGGTLVSPSSGGSTAAAALDTAWLTVNGTWALLLFFGLLGSSLALVRARGWLLFGRRVRGLLADYGVAIMLVAFTGLSFAVRGTGVNGVPRRVQTPQTWEVKNNWTVAARMADVPSAYIAAALIPALIISILFFFDHNVSSQMAQQPEFGLTKPSAYHYDMLLVAGTTLLCGLLGLPPVNGVLPQAPMHTRALADLKRLMAEARERKQEQQLAKAQKAAAHTTIGGPTAAAQKPTGMHDSAACADAGHERVHAPSPAAGAGVQLVPRGVISPFAAANGAAHAFVNGAASRAADGVASRAADGAAHESNAHPAANGLQVQAHAAGEEAPSSSSDARVVLSNDKEGASAAAAKPHHAHNYGVQEQRMSNLIQSLLVAVCLGITPAIQQIPTSLLWGIFAYMAIESLPGCQFWERLLLLITDPKCRVRLLEQSHATYLQAVPFRVIVMFTLMQLVLLMGIWALVTWAGIAGAVFPVPIMLLVPFRQYVLPRIFAHEHLNALDQAEYEQAEPLPHEQAQLEAASLGIAPASSEPSRRSSRSSSEELQTPEFLSRRTVVHRVSQLELHERMSHSTGSLPLHSQDAVAGRPRQ